MSGHLWLTVAWAALVGILGGVAAGSITRESYSGPRLAALIATIIGAVGLGCTPMLMLLLEGK